MKEKKQFDMISGHPGSALAVFVIPMILGNLFQQFYNMADSVIVGRFVGENALAAVGASYALTNVFIMVAIGGGIGASVLTSQFLGARQYGNMKTSISSALITFVCLSLCLGALGLVFNERILQSLNTPENILSDAVLYLNIYFLGLPFLFMYNILSSVFNALGDSKTPLCLLIFSSVLNVILDLLSVTVFGRGVDGVAIATVAAQGIAALISFGILLKRLKGYEAGRGEFRYFDRAMVLSGTKIAVPSILQQSIVSIGMLLVQSVVNGFGSSALAGYSAGMRVESICIVPMIAMGNAMSTFTAQNMGAGKPERVKQGYRASMLMVFGAAAVICVIIELFYRQIIAAFLDVGAGTEAASVGWGYLSFIGWFFVFIGLKAITDGVLRGAGDVVVFTIANLINLSIRVSVAFGLAPVWGIQAVWMAVPMGWAANFLISFLWYRTGRWSRKKLVKKEKI